MFESLGASVTEVRRPQQLEGLDGLVIPGGESTVIVKLANRYGLPDALRRSVVDGGAVGGTGPRLRTWGLYRDGRPTGSTPSC